MEAIKRSARRVAIRGQGRRAIYGERVVIDGDIIEGGWPAQGHVGCGQRLYHQRGLFGPVWCDLIEGF